MKLINACIPEICVHFETYPEMNRDEWDFVLSTSAYLRSSLVNIV